MNHNTIWIKGSGKKRIHICRNHKGHIRTTSILNNFKLLPNKTFSTKWVPPMHTQIILMEVQMETSNLFIGS